MTSCAMSFFVFVYISTVMMVIVEASYHQHVFGTHDCSSPRSNFQVCGQGMKCIEGECAQTVYADVACRAALFGPANLGRPELFPVTAFQKADNPLCVYCVDNLEPTNTVILPCNQISGHQM